MELCACQPARRIQLKRERIKRTPKTHAYGDNYYFSLRFLFLQLFTKKKKT